MVQVRLAYGRHGIEVDLPADVLVVQPRYVRGLEDEEAALRQALCVPIGSPPLQSLARPGQTAVIVHSDLTRPMPNDRVLPVLLSELEAAGVAQDDITVLNGVGTHRPQTKGELAQLLGPEICAQYRCEQHDCWDDSCLVAVGSTHFGHPVRVNRTYLEADLKILTGFIEPHFFAGFSGGPKAVLPAIAAAESVLANHSADMIGHSEATWGVTRGNPVWEEMLEAALETDPTFLLNVTLNRDGKITGVFAGDLEAAHAAGCDFCRQSAMVAVPHLFDIVITTNSGYPLDLNLYQAVKGMSAAARVVRPGGSIILAAECWDGIPEHGEYASLLRSASNPQQLLDQIAVPGFFCMDQWEAQVQALIQLRADVYVYSDGLSDEQIREGLLTPCRRIEETLETLLKRYGRDATICVLPEGPQTIPWVRDAA